MELTVHGQTVLLTTHKSYRVTNKDETLRSVSEYPPLQSYLKTFEQGGAVPRAILLKSVLRIAHRVVGLIADADFVTPKGQRILQTIHLTGEPPAVLLPIATVGEARFGILLAHSRMAESFQRTNEAFYGSVDEQGHFTCIYNHLLQQIGFDPSSAKPVNDKQYTIGSEGKMPYRVLSVTANLTQDQLSNLGSVTDGDVTLIAVPFEVIPSVDDAKASLAATLLS